MLAALRSFIRLPAEEEQAETQCERVLPQPSYLPACSAALTAAFITPQLEKKRTRLPVSDCRGPESRAGIPDCTFSAILSSPVPCASRMRAVSLRARSSGKLSATKTSLPRVVITTGPSLVE